MKNIKPFNEKISFWNGFFKVNDIKNLETLKHFFRDALELSYDSHVDILKTFTRERHPSLTPTEFIEKYITLDDYHVAIDRFVHSGYMINNKYGEIGTRIMGKTDIFLFIYVSYEDFYDLIEKYNLSK